jgi:hypothetical protein
MPRTWNLLTMICSLHADYDDEKAKAFELQAKRGEINKRFTDRHDATG